MNSINPNIPTFEVELDALEHRLVEEKEQKLEKEVLYETKLV